MSIKQGHRAKFQRITRELRDLMEDIREYNDEAWCFVEGSGTIFLMEGRSPLGHSGERQEHIEEESVCIPSMDAGGW